MYIELASCASSCRQAEVPWALLPTDPFSGEGGVALSVRGLEICLRSFLLTFFYNFKTNSNVVPNDPPGAVHKHFPPPDILYADLIHDARLDVPSRSGPFRDCDSVANLDVDLHCDLGKPLISKRIRFVRSSTGLIIWLHPASMSDLILSKATEQLLQTF
jgi:hypothetical protein